MISSIGPILSREEFALGRLTWAQVEMIMTETTDRLESMKTTLDNEWDQFYFSSGNNFSSYFYSILNFYMLLLFYFS